MSLEISDEDFDKELDYLKSVITCNHANFNHKSEAAFNKLIADHEKVKNLQRTIDTLTAGYNYLQASSKNYDDGCDLIRQAMKELGAIRDE